MVNPNLVIVDNTEEFNKAVKAFKRDAVLVGIPESDTVRKDKDLDTEQGISNAALLAINVFGSPINNIPARDVMTIGLRNAKDDIAEQFKKAAQNVLSKGLSALTVYYNRAGFIASSAIKKAINDQEGIDPPADSTLKSRAARGFKGTKALVVTGQMRNAITYVLQSIFGNG